MQRRSYLFDKAGYKRRKSWEASADDGKIDFKSTKESRNTGILGKVCEHVRLLRVVGQAGERDGTNPASHSKSVTYTENSP